MWKLVGEYKTILIMSIDRPTKKLPTNRPARHSIQKESEYTFESPLMYYCGAPATTYWSILVLYSLYVPRIKIGVEAIPLPRRFSADTATEIGAERLQREDDMSKK